MKIETEFGTFLALEEVKSLKGQAVKTRAELVKLAREGGAEVADDAAVAVLIVDEEVTYIIEDEYSFVFYQDGLFVPANWEELATYAAEALKK